MENWGLITYRETSILFDKDETSNGFKRRVVSVIAHEMAHQWFGNLVTMKVGALYCTIAVTTSLVQCSH